MARFQGEIHVWSFDWPIYIRLWPGLKVRDMYGLSIGLFTLGLKVKAMYGLSIGLFTLDFGQVSR